MAADRIQNQYLPDHVSPPGETLLETLETIGMSQAELAERTGRPKKTINEIIKGKAAITPETALQLERVLGIPASFWNNREHHYREALARMEEQERLQKHVEWLKKMPVRAMIKEGWIKPFKDNVQQLQEVLNFFGVASPEQWQELWLEKKVAFRKSVAFQSDPGAVAAWLRRGEIQAQRIDCASYDAEKFRDALRRIRSLTVEPPEVFQKEIVCLCGQAGAAVVFVPELPKTRVSGATRWLSSNKALIQLSLRYKSDDQLWFTFFHEAGHILLHSKRAVFLEENGPDDTEEQEANSFAAKILIPEAELHKFKQSGDKSKTAIQRFAVRIGVAPGIVVGRLQHDGFLPLSHCNDLKKRFVWTKHKAA